MGDARHPVGGTDPRRTASSEPPERLLAGLRGIGASLFVTDEHLIIVRDGAERRPRSGVRRVPIDAIGHIRLEPGTGSAGRLAVWTPDRHETVSIFFDARSHDHARHLVDVLRPLVSSARRRRRIDETRTAADASDEAPG